MEDNKNYERGEHLENITDASMKDDDYFNASRNIDRKYITIEGARENNLKNINVKIPRDKFVVVTGLSGSGKSSLAFDTIYAEGQNGESLPNQKIPYLHLFPALGICRIKVTVFPTGNRRTG